MKFTIPISLLITLSACAGGATCGVQAANCQELSGDAYCDPMDVCANSQYETYYENLNTGDVVCCDEDINACAEEAVDLFCDF